MVVTNVGLNQERDFLFGDVVVPPNRIAIGQGTAPAAATDVALQNERFRDLFTNKLKPGVGKAEFHLLVSSTSRLGEWPVGSGVSEIGAVNAASGGSLYFRQVFQPFARVANANFQFEVLITRQP